MESSFVFHFNISHFSSINSIKPMSKRTQEDASEERVTAKSKPMMNLVSRCHVRVPNVLASIASESSLDVQQTSTGRPVLGASLSIYSGWNIDDKWSSQVWKSGEMSGTSTGRPVDDKFVIDDEMDSDTAAESNLSLKSRGRALTTSVTGTCRTSETTRHEPLNNKQGVR